MKKQFSKNMMKMQLSEGRLDGASKDKWEKKAMSCLPLVTRAKYVQMIEDICRLFVEE